jgi:hypothetical protein
MYIVQGVWAAPGTDIYIYMYVYCARGLGSPGH